MSKIYYRVSIFVQIGAYGNKKYAIEAQEILKSEIQNISINEVYSNLSPGKLLHSVISGPMKIDLQQITLKKKLQKMVLTLN